MMMPLLLPSLIIALSPRIHRIVRALREPVLALAIMRDDGAVHRARIIIRDASDHDAIGAGRGTIVYASGYDGEF